MSEQYKRHVLAHCDTSYSSIAQYARTVNPFQSPGCSTNETTKTEGRGVYSRKVKLQIHSIIL